MIQEIKLIDLNLVNCYLAKTEEGFLLFDTGGPVARDKSYTDRRAELENSLNQEGVRPGNLKAIVLTHGDLDHVFNASYLREKYNTVIAMHEGDIKLVEDLTVDRMMESFRFRSFILKILFFLLGRRLREISAKQLDKFRQFSPDVLLKEGESLSRYGFDAEIIHLPGHTAGSIGILTRDGELICGDTFTLMKKPSPSPNAFSFKELKNSINKVNTMKINIVYPGHGKPFKACEIKM